MTIVACGGSGTRMAPVTRFINKHLIPIGNGELMVDAPLKFLSRHGIDEITVVTGSNHASQICDYIGDGKQYGFNRVEYSFQPKPAGIADVLLRVSHRDVEGGVLLILGDNYFSEVQPEVPFGCQDRAIAWEYDIESVEKAKAFGQVIRSKANGVIPIDIIEKPKNPEHTKILTGLYYFPADVFEYVQNLTPSARGELEITSLLMMYADKGMLDVLQVNGKWADLGEHHTWTEFVAERKNKAEAEADLRGISG